MDNGLNWGYCAEQGKDRKLPMVKYRITITTSSVIDSNTQSEVFITLFGDNNAQTDEMSIGSNFELGQKITEVVEAKDVGKVVKARLRVKGQRGWRAYSIQVNKGGLGYYFESIKYIKGCVDDPDDSCTSEIYVDGNNSYVVKVETDSSTNAGNPGPFFFAVYGDKAKGNLEWLSQKALQKGSVITKRLRTLNVGKVNGFKLRVEGKGDWKPKSVTITDSLTQKIKTFTLDNVMLNKEFKPEYEFFEDNPKQGKKASKKSLGEGGGQNEKEIGLNVDDPWGGLIGYADRKIIIDLDCNDAISAEDKRFGYKFSSQNCGYMAVLARCPATCHKSRGIVLGVGLHPMESPICLSAIVDRAVSAYGGVFQINVFYGLNHYEVPRQFTSKYSSIDVKSKNGMTAKSYNVVKVDNPDLIEKDMRILDDKGMLSNVGRIEFRIDGEWGTICSQDNNSKSAELICLELGYKGGVWKNPEINSKGFCSSFEGKDYCGAEDYKIYFTALSCSNEDKNIATCLKAIANPDNCAHDLDSIIECYNENYNSETRVPNGVIRLKSEKIDEAKGTAIGRAEMYFNSRWGAICNLEFNKFSANLMCQKMGFETGVLITGEKALEFQNKPDAREVPFSASNYKCAESDKDLGTCSKLTSNILCTHDLDVVLECQGTKGDVSGDSQYKIPVSNSPQKGGKLGYSDHKIDCETRGNDIRFRGDPGSVYIVKCPKNCTKRPYALWGSGTYSEDSSICLAAIHNCLIDDTTGGTVVLSRTHGSQYFSSTSACGGVTSRELHSDCKYAFTVSQMNSGVQNMNNLWKKSSISVNHKSFLETEDNSELAENTQIALYSSKRKTQQSMFPSAALPQYSSFLQTSSDSDLPAPVFAFVETDPLKTLSSKNNYLLPQGRMETLEEFTIVTSFRMSGFNQEDTVLFSFGFCGGFSLYISKKENLVIGDICNSSKKKNLPYVVPLDVDVTFLATMRKDKFSFDIYEDTKRSIGKRDLTAKFIFPPRSEIGLGRQPVDNLNCFNGKIHYFGIFNKGLEFNEMNKAIRKIKDMYMPKISAKSLTEDGRLCVSSCMTSSQESAIPPPEAEINAPGNFNSDSDGRGSTNNNQSNNRNTNQNYSSPSSGSGGFDNPQSKPSQSYPGYNRPKPSYTKPKLDDDGSIANKPNNPLQGDETSAGSSMKEMANVEGILLDDDSTLEDKRLKFVAIPGKFFRVTCPQINEGSRAVVFGKAIYRSTSSICRAAIHFGKLKYNESKDVIVRVDDSKQFYLGSEENGVRSLSLRESDKTKPSFTVELAPNLRRISCSTSLEDEYEFKKARVDSRFVVVCPENCSKNSLKVYGGKVTPKEECDEQVIDQVASPVPYSPDSPICMAAIHHGAMNDLGGEVEFRIEGEQSQFTGSESFGITSLDKGEQVKAYSFVGARSAIYAHYIEKYTGRVNENWKINVDLSGVHDRNDNQWTFLNNEEVKIRGVGEKVTGIRHTGRIRTILNPKTTKYHPVTWISLRKTDFSNGRIKFNLLLQDLKPIYVMLRYTDVNNYIGMEINLENQMTDFKLFPKIGGSVKDGEVKGYRKTLALGIWYRFVVYLNSNNIKILMQSGDQRAHKVLFDTEMTGFSRGSIAFGTNGNSEFYINGVQIDDINTTGNKKTTSQNLISIRHLLNDCQDDRKVRNYCNQQYELIPTEIPKCKSPYNYCQLKCQSFFPQFDNLMRFTCFRQCTNTMIKKNSPIDSGSPVERKFELKIGKMIDYIPLSSRKSLWTKGTVMKIEKVQDDKSIVEIMYIDPDDDFKEKKESVVFPSEDGKIASCGSHLTKRKDCVTNPSDQVDDD